MYPLPYDVPACELNSDSFWISTGFIVPKLYLLELSRYWSSRIDQEELTVRAGAATLGHLSVRSAVNGRVIQVHSLVWNIPVSRSPKNKWCLFRDYGSECSSQAP